MFVTSTEVLKSLKGIPEDAPDRLEQLAKVVEGIESSGIKLSTTKPDGSPDGFGRKAIEILTTDAATILEGVTGGIPTDGSKLEEAAYGTLESQYNVAQRITAIFQRDGIQNDGLTSSVSQVESGLAGVKGAGELNGSTGVVLTELERSIFNAVTASALNHIPEPGNYEQALELLGISSDITDPSLPGFQSRKEFERWIGQHRTEVDDVQRIDAEHVSTYLGLVQIAEASILAEYDRRDQTPLERSVLAAMQGAAPEAGNYDQARNFLGITFDIADYTQPGYQTREEFESWTARRKEEVGEIPTDKISAATVAAYLDRVQIAEASILGEYDRNEPFTERAKNAWYNFVQDHGYDLSQVQDDNHARALLGFKATETPNVDEIRMRLSDIELTAKSFGLFNPGTASGGINEFLIGIGERLGVSNADARRALDLPPAAAQQQQQQDPAAPLQTTESRFKLPAILGYTASTITGAIVGSTIATSFAASLVNAASFANRAAMAAKIPLYQIGGGVIGVVVASGALFGVSKLVGWYRNRSPRQTSIDRNIASTNRDVVDLTSIHCTVEGATSHGNDAERTQKCAESANVWIIDNRKDNKEYAGVVCLTRGIEPTPHGKLGAEIALHAAENHLNKWNKTFRSDMNRESNQDALAKVLSGAADAATEAIKAKARELNADPKELACTFMLSVSTPKWAATLHLGDGAVVVEKHNNGQSQYRLQSTPYAPSVDEGHGLIIEQPDQRGFTVTTAEKGGGIGGVLAVSRGLEDRLLDLDAMGRIEQYFNDAPQHGRSLAGLEYVRAQLMDLPGDQPDQSIAINIHN